MNIEKYGFSELNYDEVESTNGGGAWDILKDVYSALPGPAKGAIVVVAAGVALYEGGKKVGSAIAEVIYWSTH